MATTFKNAVLSNTGAVATTLYTAPGATTSVVTGLVLANTTASQVLATVTVTDTSGGVTINVIKSAPLPAGANLVVLDTNSRLVLETTDVVKVQSDTATSIDSIISVMEIT